MALPNQIAGRAAQRVFTQIFAPINVEQVDINDRDLVQISEMGTPVFDRLVIGSNNEGADDNYINELGQSITVKPLIIDTVLIDVQQTNNIVKTSVQGRSGTVKEYINRGDFALTFKGFISNLNKNNINVFPEEHVKNFVNIMKKNGSIIVTNARLNDVYKIDEVVITNYNLPTVEGLTNLQAFSFTAISELPKDFQLVLEE
jgi:hypothetical protein